MSGICGIVRLDGGAVKPRDIERQMNAMRHLGPDRRRAWCDGAVGLGHLLMRVTQEDALDAQPLCGKNGLVLVADLRLDNREDLAATLGIDSAALADLADSDLLLRAYETWGDRCVDRLLGDFVFAIWDSAARKLVLARDAVGQRRIVFHRGPHIFAFATDFKGLWALGDVPRVLQDPLTAAGKKADRLTGIAISPFEGIEALQGGTVMTVARDGGVTTRRYWEPHADPQHRGKDEDYYVEAYRRVLGEAVACRLRRTTRPAGLLFGGGFDSSAIAALAGPVVRAQGRKFIAAASVMPKSYRGTIRHARRWAETCERHMPDLDMRYVTREGRNIFTGMEKSFFDTDLGHSPNRYVTDELYSTIAAAGARVVMDGHGGDYTLNVRNFPWLMSALRAGEFRRFFSELRAYRGHVKRSYLRILGQEVFRHLVPMKILNLRHRIQHGLALSGSTLPLQEKYGAARFDFSHEGTGRLTTGKRWRAKMLTTLQRLQNSRAMGGAASAAAHGLEFTQPFHDKRVIELALAIPEELWVKGGRERYLARKALKDLYPPEFQTRGRGNDDLIPDFLDMYKSIEPQMLAEIDRMERDGKLSHRFDFPRMRKMLTRRRAGDHNNGSEYDTRQATLMFLSARYNEWFERSNR